MENFIVSARKYRPQTFDTVVGQQHITTTLKNAITHNQLAHAFLFCGPRGVGKTTCARILAKTINCENPAPGGEACDQCASCKSFNEGGSFNIHELDAASNNSVDDIRTLAEQVRFAPQAGKYKIYIIDEVHMLSAAAFNAFLKTLEEPPSYAIFILATTEKHKILPTILSRCQIFDFRRITAQDTVDHLKEICRKEEITADDDALHIIAQKSEGCMRDALSILDKIVSFTGGRITYSNTLEHLNILDYDYFFRVLDAIAGEDTAQALLILDEILQKGFEGDNFLNGLAEFIRNILVCKDKRVAHLLEASENLRNRYYETARQTDTGLLISSLHLLNEAGIHYKQAGNKRLHVEMALIKLCYLQQAVQLVSAPRNGEVSKKKVTNPSQVQRLRGPLAQPVPISRSPVPDSLVSEPEASLVIQEQAVQSARQATSGSSVTKDATADKPAMRPAPDAATGNKLSDLRTLRKKIADNHVQSRDTGKEARALTQEEAVQSWEEYISRLRSAEKIQLTSNMELAQLQVKNEAEIVVVCRNELQRRFIEEEKMNLADHFKKAFRNPALIFSISVDETMEPAREAAPVLSAKEQYQRLIEKYPLVRELRDKLNLELDY